MGDATASSAAGYKPMARLVSYAVAGVPNENGRRPDSGLKLALKKAGLTLDQMDVIESNEAFAAQAIAVARGLNLDMTKTNPEWRSDCTGTPDRLLGRVPGGESHLRIALHWKALCAGDDVHRRWAGDCGGV